MNYLIWSSGFALGNWILQQLPMLPSIYLLGIGIVLGLIVLFFSWKYRYKSLASIICGFMVGFGWTWGWAGYYLDLQLPKELIKENVQLVGQIATIPQLYAHHVTFNFRVQSVSYQGKHYPAPRYIRLSWYADTYSKAPVPIPHLQVGQTWNFTVRLKPPHSFASPGAGDYSQHLFSQHIGAVGYIYTRIPPELITEKTLWPDWVNMQREDLWERLNSTLNAQPQSGIIAALALGERGNITQDEWKILQATGTSHLVAISGLHVGLVAGLVLTAVTFVWRFLPSLTERFPASVAGSLLGLVIALIYSALAGFAVPTQRALIMLVLVMYGMLQQRASARIYTFASAVVIVLLYDPLATLSISFWLSYIAVAAIFFTMAGRQIKSIQPAARWREWGHLQWGISCLLTPVTLWFFQQTPLVSPLANAIAIPWVSFIVVPLTLVGSLMLYFWDGLGNALLQLALFSMQLCWYVLEWFATWPYATWQFSLTNPWIFACISVSTIILLVPKGVPGRYYGVIGLLPLWLMQMPRPAYGEVWIDVLDVGQGLATVVRTAQHSLLYDAGEAFSERLNAGSAVILPFLRSHGVQTLDALIISHDNKDHSGGAEPILEQFPVKTLYAGDNWRTPLAKAIPCKVGQQWDWDGVTFTMLHPDVKDNWHGNNASCVLKISSGQHSALFTGDIESGGERSLLQKQPDLLPSTIIIAPHHGSRSSSTVKFLQQVQPEYVIFPAGYLNRFNFPNPKIVERYQQVGAVMLVTATHGTIHLAFDANEVAIPVGFRQQYRRYWTGLPSG
ncbi:MAG: DNA internalization-related competence protein ComEC/Rec2 [Gammaproteobacteria bacterium]